LNEIPPKEIEKQKREAKAWIRKGYSLERKEKYEEAIECYDRAIELDPESSDAWGAKGVALDHADQIEEALKCYNRSTEIRPKYAIAWSNKGFLLSNLEKYDEAIRCFDKSLELKPNKAEDWSGKGVALFNLRNYNEAIICFDKYISLDPKNIYIWDIKAQALRSCGKSNDALECFDRAIEFNPNIVLLVGKGFALNDLKKYDEAIHHFNKAINEDGGDCEAHCGKGIALTGLGRYEEALDSYNRAIDLDAEDPESWRGKGRALQALGRNLEADAAFFMAKELEDGKVPEPPTLPETIQDIQSILERKGQVILYGPPGTGKTYWAIRAAQELSAQHINKTSFEALTNEQKASIIGNGKTEGIVRICCFHPAYGYEDFLEGYRPENSITASDQISFALRDGIFKRLCKDAQAKSEISFFLIIDEINRGDIPRIFGELMTILEKNKRSKSIVLPLSGESFKVPNNVYVIGTMNTADRSIALLDAALRRRFGFVELMPDISLFGDTALEGIRLSDFLKSLNNRICEQLGRDARNYQIGHSYLLEGGYPISDFSKFAKVLQEDIIPLLEEYCYEDYSMLGKILGSELIDADRQQIRNEIFDESNKEKLKKVIQDMISEDDLSNKNSKNPDEETLDGEPGT
jgi:tetratricopeptide (TPR) repeat protein